jgi:hypothetical protein
VPSRFDTAPPLTRRQECARWPNERTAPSSPTTPRETSWLPCPLCCPRLSGRVPVRKRFRLPRTNGRDRVGNGILIWCGQVRAKADNRGTKRGAHTRKQLLQTLCSSPSLASLQKTTLNRSTQQTEAQSQQAARCRAAAGGIGGSDDRFGKNLDTEGERETGKRRCTCTSMIPSQPGRAVPDHTPSVVVTSWFCVADAGFLPVSPFSTPARSSICLPLWRLKLSVK